MVGEKLNRRRAVPREIKPSPTACRGAKPRYTAYRGGLTRFTVYPSKGQIHGQGQFRKFKIELDNL